MASSKFSATASNGSVYQKVLEMLNRVGVPDDTRWRSLILYFREMKDYTHLTDIQKGKVQALLTDVLSKKDFSDERLNEVLTAYHDIITQPFKGRVDEMLNEASTIVNGFQKLLSERYGNIDSLETTTIQAVEEKLPGEALVERLRGAFYGVKELIRHDMITLEEMAHKDALTGIANRRAFDEFINGAIKSWKGHNAPLSLALIDIDFFKKFNDTYGHRVGDQVLQLVAKQVDKRVKQLDGKGSRVLAARYGGEEFAIAFSGSVADKIKVVTETIRNAISDFNFLIRGTNGEVLEDGLHVTISAGIAFCDKSWGESFIEARLVECADKALYAAKGSGRNKVMQYSLQNNEEKFTVVTAKEEA